MYKNGLHIFTQIWLVLCLVMIIRDCANRCAYFISDWNLKMIGLGLAIDFIYQLVKWIKAPPAKLKKQWWEEEVQKMRSKI